MQEPATTFEVSGRAIREARMQAGISVQELAHAVGVSDNYIQKLERGDRKRLRPGPYLRMRLFLKTNSTALLAPRRGPEDTEGK
jgi:transcriptional regulator with XRE-family HTH domain